MHLRATSVLLAAGTLLLASACGESGRDAARTADAAPATAASLSPAAGGASAASAPMPQGGDSALMRLADQARIQGSASAPVWMVIVSDFQCPFCRMWHDSTYGAIRREYVQTGKIRMAYLNLPLGNHKHAWPAAEAAMCAGAQQKFWEMQDAIFSTQEQWTPLDNAVPVFDSLAAKVGVDVARYRSCVTSGAIRPLIQADRERSVDAGVQSTPMFLIGQERVRGAAPIAQFREVIDRALGAAGAVKR